MSEQVEVKKAICMWCHGHCSVAVEISNGRLVKITGNGDHPHGKALTSLVKACPRARAAAEWFYHPDRLSYPLKRVGERGEGKWESISWEQALDEIAEKLKTIREKYGAEAIATSSGTARTADEYKARFFSLLGSPNSIGQGQICYGPDNLIASAIIGWPADHMHLRPETKCILLIGTNPHASTRHAWFPIRDAKKAGVKLIVIDPRRTKTAEKADVWLQLRPGTDTALLTSMINIIITEGLYDKDFVEKWCYGFDELAGRANEYPPEKVAEITWVPAERIKEAARMYATNRPATSVSMMGLEHLANGMEALCARFILPAITGNIDVRGGNMLRPSHPQIVPESEIELNDRVSPDQKTKTLGGDRFRLLSWPGYDLIQENQKRVWGTPISRLHNCFAHAPTVFRAMFTDKPYSVRALITMSSNPMVTMPNTKLVYKALKSLDLYVVMDYWMTPSADLSDYVLPAASWLERPTVYTFGDTIGFIGAGEAALPSVVEGKYDRKTDYEFWRGLGIRLGQEEYWPWKNLEEGYDYRLKPLGYTLKEFVSKRNGYDATRSEPKKYEKIGFATPTGKVELYSTILERLGYDPLPRYEEPPESPISTPELAKEYPLILITGGRFQPYFHSEQRQIDSLRKQRPNPVIQINPEKASELGIRNGDWVWIETPRGRVRQKCEYFKGIDPRVVHAQHGWWLPELPGEEPWLHGVWESNINVLTDDEPDHCNKIGGLWPLRALLCKVYKVKQC
ncbi:MAG: molybdopterin-dependent oxidoreductase [Deltaproteobacteria bacterium]|nr:MAG: molybdopterin-dependent oxidoreductase [Deltaproteobacteria bacterium]